MSVPLSATSMTWGQTVYHPWEHRHLACAGVKQAGCLFPQCVLLVGTHYMSEHSKQCKPERTSLLSASVSHFEKPRQEQQGYAEHHDYD